MSDRRQPNEDTPDRAQGEGEPIRHPVTLRFGSRKITLPRSRVVRMGLGVTLILAGFLGFLPILGFWMLPLGLMVLSVDLPFARRWRRRLIVWWSRRRKEMKNSGDF